MNEMNQIFTEESDISTKSIVGSKCEPLYGLNFKQVFGIYDNQNQNPLH